MFCAASLATACALSHGRDAAGEHDAAGEALDAAIVLDARASIDAHTCTVETCDGADQDCDGVIDEDSSGSCVFEHAVGECRRGVCALAACERGYDDCDGVSANGCEVSTADDRANCGGCGVECALRESCGMGACVDDAIVAIAPAARPHSCVLTESGRVICWGTNEFGVMGPERLGERFAPTEIAGLPPMTQIGVSYKHMCAVDRTGAVWCWGYGGHDYLGVPDSSAPLVWGTPVQVPLPGPARELQLAGRGCVILDDGSVQCWGRITDDPPDPMSTPNPVPGLASIEELAGVGLSFCALESSGRLLCWGHGATGTLGDGSSGRQIEPGPIAGLGLVRTVECGTHCCGIGLGGEVSCWGENHAGQVGSGVSSRYPPSLLGRVDIEPARAIAVVGQYEMGASCAVSLDGRLLCWGSAEMNGTGEAALRPRLVPLEEPVRLLAGNDSSICVVMGTSRVRCWGRNFLGQIGDGTTEHAWRPTAVVGFE